MVARGFQRTRETKENDGGRRYGYIQDKQEKGAPQDDRISSIQIRQVKKKRKKWKEVRKWQERIKQKERIEENKTTGWRVSPWISRTPCFLSWISGVTKENTKTG